MGKNGKKLSGVEEGEIIIRIYYVRKKAFFNQRKKKKNYVLSFSTSQNQSRMFAILLEMSVLQKN